MQYIFSIVFAYVFFNSTINSSCKLNSIVNTTPLLLRVNAGGNTITTNGKTFEKDVFFVGGNTFSNNNISDILNTFDDEVFKSERSGSSGFSYQVPMTNGLVTIRLYFAEIYFGATAGGPSGNGKRIFDVSIEGENKLSNFDINNEVGAEYATFKEYEVSVSDGELNLDFSASVDQPKLSAIEIFGNNEIIRQPNTTCDWINHTNANNERLESQSAKVNGKLYVFAGFLANLKITGATEEYDPSTNLWSTKAPMPVPVTHMGTVVDGDDIWIIGGFTGNHPGVGTDLVQVYNTVTNTWRNETKIPIPTGSLAAAILNRKIYIFGGLDSSDRHTDINDHFMFDLNNKSAGWIRLADLPFGRNHHSGAAVLGKIYAIGGQFGHDKGTDDQKFLHAYDPNTNTWERKADLPTDRSHFEPGTLVYNDKIIIVGGRNQGVFFDQTTQYDPVEDKWTDLCTLPDKLLAPVAKEFNGKLYVSNGGVNGINEPSSRTISMNLSVNEPVLHYESIAEVKKYFIFPNPTNNKIEILLENDQSTFSARVFNGIGQQVTGNVNFSSSQKISLNYLEKGIYFLELKDNDENISVEKIVLE